MTILVIAEHDNAGLKSATLHTIAAAQKLGDEIHVLVAGHGAEAVATAAAAIPNVAKVLRASAQHLAQPTAENVAAVALQVTASGNYTHVLAPATSFGKNAAPRIAAKLDVAQISDITGIESSDTFVRPIYAGNAFATVQSSDAVKVITVRTTGFDAAPLTGGNAVIEDLTVPAEITSAKVTGQELTRSERPELTSGRVAGRSRCGLRSQRLSGGPDRKNRRARPVRGGGNLGRHPAFGGDEGQQGDRCDQQGRRGADIPDRRLWAGRGPV